MRSFSTPSRAAAPPNTAARASRRSGCGRGGTTSLGEQLGEPSGPRADTPASPRFAAVAAALRSAPVASDRRARSSRWPGVPSNWPRVRSGVVGHAWTVAELPPIERVPLFSRCPECGKPFRGTTSWKPGSTEYRTAALPLVRHYRPVAPAAREQGVGLDALMTDAADDEQWLAKIRRASVPRRWCCLIPPLTVVAHRIAHGARSVAPRCRIGGTMAKADQQLDETTTERRGGGRYPSRKGRAAAITRGAASSGSCTTRNSARRRCSVSWARGTVSPARH